MFVKNQSFFLLQPSRETVTTAPHVMVATQLISSVTVSVATTATEL